MMPNPALADWKKRERLACSSTLYQLPMMKTVYPVFQYIRQQGETWQDVRKPGEIVDSKTPCRNRKAASWLFIRDKVSEPCSPHACEAGAHLRVVFGRSDGEDHGGPCDPVVG
jgi:hypothetical protein